MTGYLFQMAVNYVMLYFPSARVHWRGASRDETGYMWRVCGKAPCGEAPFSEL